MSEVGALGVSQRQRVRMAQMVTLAKLQRWYDGLDPCVYCGVIADSIDHIPPKSARDRIVDLGLAERYPFLVVTACRECNSVLGARGLWTLSARRDYVKKALRRRYSDVLRIPDWTDSDLAQLSPEMRGYVLNGIYVREFIRERIRYEEPMERRRA